MSINTSSRLAERILYYAMFSDFMLVSTYLNISSIYFPKDLGTLYTVYPDSSIVLAKGTCLASVFSK